MVQDKKDDLRVRGLSVSASFGLSMTLALAVVMGVAGFFLSNASEGIAEDGIDKAMQDTARLMAENQPSLSELSGELRKRIKARFDAFDIDPVGRITGLDDELVVKVRSYINGVRADLSTKANEAVSEALKTATDAAIWAQYDSTAVKFAGDEGLRFNVIFKEPSAHAGEQGYLYQFDTKGNVLARKTGETGRGMFGLIVGSTIAVIVFGAGVAYGVGRKVAAPLEQMVEDVRQIARGHLDHRTRVRGGGEVELLGRSISRMTEALAEAQDAEIELSMREREMEVAQEVREALLPKGAPKLAGYEVGDLHLPCPESEGDFYDYLQAAGGKLGLLVCQVNGKGVPGALVGATARAYLRNELERGGDLEGALRKVNRDLARDVRRGMYVTALYALLDPAEHKVSVVCAGHKLPILRFSAADKQLRLVQPDGIAFAFDKGPVFEKRLEVQTIALEPGDRLVLSNLGPVQALNAEEQEYGEKPFYRSVLRAAQHEAGEMLTRIQVDLEEYVGEEPLPADICLMMLARKR